MGRKRMGGVRVERAPAQAEVILTVAEARRLTAYLSTHGRPDVQAQRLPVADGLAVVQLPETDIPLVREWSGAMRP